MIPPIMDPTPGTPGLREALDLEAIEARANLATPAPWRVNKYGGIGTGENGVTDSVVGSDGMNPFYEPGCPFDNTSFIAHARQDIPDLIAEVRRLRALLQSPQPREDDKEDGK